MENVFISYASCNDMIPMSCVPNVLCDGKKKTLNNVAADLYTDAIPEGEIRDHSILNS